MFEPYVIYRMNTGLPSQFEVAGVLHLNHVIWLGGSFKQDFGISALGGIKLQNFFLIGGSYSLKNTGINELNSPTYEIHLSYLFGAKRKDKPVYSFVNTVKEKEKKKLPPAAKPQPSAPIVARTTPEQAKQEQARQEEEAKQEAARQEAAAEQARKEEEARQQEAARQEELRRQQATQQQQQTQQEQARREEEAKRQAAQQAQQQQQQPPPEEPVVPRRHDGGPRLKSDVFSIDLPTYDTAHHEEQARLSRLEEHAVNPNERHEEDPDFHPHGERHEYAKRGSHREELKVGDYVIAAVFKTSSNADRYADGLKKLGFKADYGYLTEKNLWYVYIVQSKNINTAKAERDNFRKMKIFRDAWLLTVQNQ